MKLADVTYLFRWLIIHINIFLIALKFMMTFVTCVAFHIIHDYSIFEQKNGSEKNHLKIKFAPWALSFPTKNKITTLLVNMWIIRIIFIERINKFNDIWSKVFNYVQ